MSTYLLRTADAMMAQLDEMLPPDGTVERSFDRIMVASYVAAKLVGPPKDPRGSRATERTTSGERAEGLIAMRHAVHCGSVDCHDVHH